MKDIVRLSVKHCLKGCRVVCYDVGHTHSDLIHTASNLEHMTRIVGALLDTDMEYLLYIRIRCLRCCSSTLISILVEHTELPDPVWIFPFFFFASF